MIQLNKLMKKWAGIPTDTPHNQSRELLFNTANQNSDTWTKLIWISGKNINPNKCFYYYISPSINYKTGEITYETAKKNGKITIHNSATSKETIIERIEQIKHTFKQTRSYIGKKKQ